MKTEYFEKLEQFCRSEGLDLEFVESTNEHDKFYLLKKKDIWGGVEFAECIDGQNPEYTTGKIYPVKGVDEEFVDTFFDDQLDANGLKKRCMKPSTEKAYVQQLIKEAKDRFGEIKEGDVFDCSVINERWGKNNSVIGGFFEYDKKNDKLFVGSNPIVFCIYQKGKWAKKIERVEVVLNDWDCTTVDDSMISIFEFKIKNDKIARHLTQIGEHLAKCLEDYINKKATD